MEFKELIKKYFYTNSSAAASATARIPLLHNSGDPIGCDTLENIELASPTRTCGVLFATTDGSKIDFCNPYDVRHTANDYHVIFGVAIIEGGKCVIVGKDETQLQWAKSNVSGGTTAKGREQALANFDGMANTTTIYNTLGSNAPAAEYCLKYFAKDVQSTSPSVGVGNWHLPSAGELFMIYAHLIEVNRCLDTIGGTPLNRETWYWSSTEPNANGAWYVSFDIGGLSTNYKTTQGRVRPVLSL